MKKQISALAYCILTIILSSAIHAQPNFPDDEEIFRDDVVGRVDILINPDTLQWIYENVESDIEWRATFVFDNGTIHDTIENIGFRLRGNTSRQSAKKSFKVSFNTFESGRKYHGVEKMNLNGEHNDPTVARSKISWDLCSNFGIPASRSNYLRVFINDNFYGVYINVEHVDEEFVDKRFDNQDGNLYKCLWPADLNYLGSNPDLYKFESGSRRAYDLKTNTQLDDYSDIAHFIDILNNTPIEDLPCELEEIFNVQDYLKVMAMDVFTANWDGYIWNKNNFYLYHNTETGKLEYIPYDLDNTYGIDWFSEDWATRNIYEWDNQGEYRPLYERLLEVQKYRDWYSFYLSQILGLMNPDTYFARLDEIRDQIYPYILEDDYYTYDYGFSPQDFLSSYETGLGGHVPYGIEEYITARYNSAISQLELNNTDPVVNYLHVEHSGPGSMMEVQVYVFDDEENPSADLLFNINNTAWETASMIAGEDGKFTGQFEIPAGESTVLYQIEASDVSGNTTSYPCEPSQINFAPGEIYQLYINEFLAGNLWGMADEAGEHDDWMEIYNAGNAPIWLGDKYLTDNLENPDKWQFPDYTIQPQEFLLVWCDEDQEQGPFHTNFKISASGEELGIFDGETTGFAMIDQIFFDEQQTDVSYGRDPDAGENWIFYQDPTPGISNLLSATPEFPSVENRFRVFPNPVTGDMIYLNKIADIEIFSVSGQKLLSQALAKQISIASLPSGMYFLKTGEGEVFKLIKQ
ncbi:MAG: CotH kinase family protein [Bacteroidales bacterium]|nr:CotH kinase family protein [Bacteroidales bacterium]